MRTTARTLTRTAVGLTAATALAVPTALLAAGPSSADGAEREVRGSIGPGVYELGAEHDDGRIEVSVDVDRLPAGTTWRVVVRHEGQRIVNTVRRADREGDFDVDRTRPNTAGSDTFTMKITRVGGGDSAKDRLVLR